MKVLVIEDDLKISHALKKGLEQEAFVVDAAYDGVAGFDLASSETFDVVILDIMLPGMDGMTICKNLRLEGNHTPILVLTAKGQIEDRVMGLNRGADDYLPKPFAFTELLARVRALARRPINSMGELLKVNDLELDLNRFEAKRGTKPIPLSRREFNLLEYLMRHPGKVLAKDQIINSVWEYDADILPNTVEVYIGYLRQQIDKAFPNRPPLIHTARGFGYRIGKEK